MLDFIETEGLIDQVDSVQYTIRLLVPPGSLLLSRPDTEKWLGPLLQQSFTYEWNHPDPRLDELQRSVSLLVEKAVENNEDPAVTFYRIRDLAFSLTGKELIKRYGPDLSPHRHRPPRLTEAWFC